MKTLSRVRQRARRALLGVLLVYGLLVATHLGEFWPFSIYPMFSQGANPWSRVLVYEVEDDSASTDWRTFHATSDLPGEPYALRSHGLNAIDLSNFVSKTEEWNTERVNALHGLFKGRIGDRTLLVMRVNGRITPSDSVVIEYVPYARLTAQQAQLNPRLNPDLARADAR